MEPSTTFRLIPAIPEHSFPSSIMKQEHAGKQAERQVGESKSVLEDSAPSCIRIELYTGDESHVVNGSREKLYCPLHVDPF